MGCLGDEKHESLREGRVAYATQSRDVVEMCVLAGQCCAYNEDGRVRINGLHQSFRYHLVSLASTC